MDDALRHFTMGKLMAERGIFGVRGWSEWFYAGYLHDHIVDPWFLSDVLYIPFTALPIVRGLQVFSFMSVALLAACFAFGMRTLRVNPVISSLLILLLVLGHEGFTFRLLIGRPFPLMTALTLLLILCIIKKRHVFAGLILTALTLLSHLFVFPLGVAFLGIAWLWLSGKKKDATILLISSVLGVAAGVLLHPMPFEYLNYMRDIFFQTPFMDFPDRAVELTTGFGNGGPIFIILAFIILLHFLLIEDRKSKKIDLPVLLFLDVLVAAFFLQFLLWTRSMDFLWPMMLLLLGMLTTFWDNVFERLDRFLKITKSFSTVFILMIILCVTTFVPLAMILYLSEGIRSLQNYERAFSIVESGAHVLPAQWDWFAPSMAVRPDLKFADGIDPMYAYASNSGSYALLAAVLPTRFPETRQLLDSRRWLTAVLEAYPADYIMLSASRDRPVVQALRLQGLKDVSQSPKWAMFKIEKR